MSRPKSPGRLKAAHVLHHSGRPGRIRAAHIHREGMREGLGGPSATHRILVQSNASLEHVSN